ncbi:MAG: hypothetical protein OXE86_01465, partial [Alphaproteobacteria bacterium]|nr:hypothetical protein [Alphaproteobacteria bacterium]
LPGPRRSRGKYSTTSACGWRVPSSDTLLYLECQYIQTGTLGHGWNFGIAGNRFLINGEPTYTGRKRVEGLLLNARMVQGLFDDLNPQTRER